MIFVMGVTLFTSRVILDKLGIVDFGIYGSVGGIVGMLGFLNNTLGTGTSRFLTCEIVTGNHDKLKLTFSTAFYSHLALALLLAVVLELCGVWFIHNKLVIPPERLLAAECVFHFSIITMIISMAQVPYTSIITAHEKMSVYAYLGVFEAVSRLLIAYAISLTKWDKLIFYAILIAIVQFAVFFIYRLYCNRKYTESKLLLKFDKTIFKKIMSFSGWSLIGNLSEMLSNQGVVIIINMIFSPVVVAAQTIATQVANTLLLFIGNFRTAINPQIIKRYAAKDYNGSSSLTLNSTVYLFALLLLLGLPAIVIMEPLLNMWLVEVPEYTVVFTQYIIVRSLLGVFSVSFYIPLMAACKLKSNSYACVFVSIIGFIILYILLANGFSVMFVQYVGVLQSVVYSFIVKPYILCKEIGYRWKEVLACFLLSLRISVIPVIVSLIVSNYLSFVSVFSIFMAVILIVIAVIVSAYIHLDKDIKRMIHAYIYQFFFKRNY